MVDQRPNVESGERLKYLLYAYKLHADHINTMFIYFLIISGLVGDAYIQSLQELEDSGLSLSIALFGILMSVLSLLIHLRSRRMIDAIESDLAQEENKIVPPAEDVFSNASPRRASWLFRYRHQFPFAYVVFMLGFSLMAVYSSPLGLKQLLNFIGNWSQF